MPERACYPGYKEEAEAAIISAERDPERLQAWRELMEDPEWAELFGRMVGLSVPRLFQTDAYQGDVARVTFSGIAPQFDELQTRPDLLPNFMKGLLEGLAIQDLLPRR
ncbi:MAG: hypothetical protein Q8Q15_03745 [bacterium]|nr:hypothetical protein [bacterium]